MYIRAWGITIFVSVGLNGFVPQLALHYMAGVSVLLTLYTFFN